MSIAASCAGRKTKPMETKAIAAIFFGGMFGVLFIVIGVRRMLGPLKGPNRLESVIWGTVGIILGLAFFAGVAWLLTPLPADQRQNPIQTPTGFPN